MATARSAAGEPVILNAGQYELSVLLVTYNQAPFVDQAVQSILAQEIEAPFEIVVADDGSTDGTRDIIARRLSKANWTRVRFLDFSRRRGLMGNYKRAFEACDSRYVAVLEGDDYWLRKNKLAWQAAFLDAHPECPFCANNYWIANIATRHVEPRVPVSNDVSFLGPSDLIADNRPGNFSTCFYRIEALRSLPPTLFDRIAADWIVNICAARSGPLGFSHQPMSVYRRHVGGLWSGLSESQQRRLYLNCIADHDALTEHAFRGDFEKIRRKLESSK